MKKSIFLICTSFLAVFVVWGTADAFSICGNGNVEAPEECDDGNTNDYDACRNDCTLYDPYFSDMPGTHWAFQYVQRLYEAGVTSGYNDGTYRPTNNVTRAQMAAYVIKAVDSLSTDCPGNDSYDFMVRVGPICVDKYEASVWANPTGPRGEFSQFGTSSDNYPCSDNGNDCSSTNPIYARSEAGVTPSRYITWFQAQQACAMSGKRLLTNAEWQMAAAGTPDPGTDNGTTDCAVNSSNVVLTGSRSSCVSNWGVHDMVGNLQEWVADWIQDNSDIDAGDSSTAIYGNDGIFGIDDTSSTRFPAALIRGGLWAGPSAGVFALQASIGPSSSGNNTGFRCVR